MTLMGGPIDTRLNPTAVNTLANNHDLDWFRQNVIMKVPFPHPGFMREVYPGFLQISGFLSMNLDRHVTAHRDFYRHLVDGDGDSAEKHREFYDEYLAVMDLTRGVLSADGRDRVHPPRTAQGRDDASRRAGRSGRDPQRRAAHGRGRERRHLRRRPDRGRARHHAPTCRPTRKAHYLQPKVGHYGVFNGSRFRAEIAPRIADFIATFDTARPRANGKRGNGNGAAASPVAVAALPQAAAKPARKRAARKAS